MLNVNYTTNGRLSRLGYCILVFVFLFQIGIQAQAPCSLACNGSTQVSLDGNCEALITPEMILNDQATSCPDASSYEVIVMDQYNNPVPNPVPSDYCDKLLYVKVQSYFLDEFGNQVAGNSCWGEVWMEDKLPPIINPTSNICNNPDVAIPYSCSDFSVYDGPLYEDCSQPIEIILLSEEVNPLQCDPDYIKEVIRTYTAIDAKGNVGEECEIIYRLERFDFSQVECPYQYTVLDGNPLNCNGSWNDGQIGIIYDTDTDGDGVLDADPDGWDDDGDGYPDIEEFGVPTVNDVPLYPTPDFYCNIGVFHEDIVLPQVGCIRKIMRTWTIREWWCGQEFEFNCIQVFEIVDDEAPEVICEDYITVTTNVTTNPHDSYYGTVTCGAEIKFPLPYMTDNCSDVLYVDLTFPGGHVNNYDPNDYIQLPMGENYVTVTVYDECYNQTTCEVLVNVVDDTPPAAICDEFTVVGLTNDGTAHVFAETFDDGSYDDCQLKKMLVRRMDPSNCDCQYPHYNDMHHLGEFGASHYYISKYPLGYWLADDMAEAMGGHVAYCDTDDDGANGLLDWLSDHVFHYDVDEPYIMYKNGDWVTVFPDGSMGTPLATEKYNYIMRVDDPCTFSAYTIFCCEDIGVDQTVIFRVVDVYGNYNDCMVTAEVQDKLPPVVTCPPDHTVSCDEVVDLNNLDYHFGAADYHDNCNFVPTQDYEDNRNQCNIGELKRIFTATDDGGRVGTCEQIITFVNYDPFTEDQIVYPVDTTVNDGCFDVNQYHPDIIGYPEFLGDQCDLVGSNWEDQLFVFNSQPDQGCFKILRKWTVIDWCQTDANGNFFYWHHTQVIKINNLFGPTLSCPDPIHVCTYDPDCEGGAVTLTLSATDDCTEHANMKWSYHIDLFCDGQYNNHYGHSYGYVDYDIWESGDGNLADASGEYPVGTHCIIWSFEDQCGNVTSCTQEFTIINCKAPTPYCINGLAVDLMPMDTDNDGLEDWGMVELWASDFDAGSFHPCGYEVWLSFSADPEDKNMIFDCTTLGEQIVNIYASIVLPDTIIQSYCETFVDVQDNNMVCPNGGTGNAGGEEEEETEEEVQVNIEGRVTTEFEENVQEVSVSLVGSELGPDMTDDTGLYAFPPMITGGQYTIDPSKNTDPLNGVSTLDLIIIQKHILEIESLGSPYKYIAADVSNDGLISAIDLIELRKLILGVQTEFKNNESWKFVDGGYDFLNTTNPLSEDYPQVYDIAELDANMIIDFVAVKIGDVNNSVVANAHSVTTEERSDNNISFLINGSDFTKGTNKKVEFIAERDMDFYGFQFTLQVDNSISVKDILPGALMIDESNIGFSYIENGYLTFSYNKSELVSVKAGQVMFTINADVTKEKNPIQQMQINSDLVQAELYTENYNILTPVIALNGAQGNEITYDFELYQNNPNPFTGVTEIAFTLSGDAPGRLVITDVNGKVIHAENGSFVKGLNTIRLSSDKLQTAGILYYTLETEMNTATKKMVVLR